MRTLSQSPGHWANIEQCTVDALHVIHNADAIDPIEKSKNLLKVSQTLRRVSEHAREQAAEIRAVAKRERHLAELRRMKAPARASL